jgi:outer membrane protein OmpU
LKEKLKKLGLSALAGSLVAVSAQAGEIGVSGSANVSYVTKSGTKGTALGTDKDVSFTGKGELDNGWTFTVSTTLDDAYAVSSSYTSITMGSMGTVSFGADTGGAAYKYDEEVPQAYEQTSDAQQNSANIVGNRMDSNMIVWNAPAMDISGATVNLDFEYSPNASGNNANDGGTITAADADTNNTDVYGMGYGVGLTVAYDALKVGVYGTVRENDTPTASNATGHGVDAINDDFQGVWYAKYSMGPVSFGYSQSYHDAGRRVQAEATTAAKVVGIAGGFFESESMSVAFNVTDDFSLSYTDTDDTYDSQSTSTAAAGNDVVQSTRALQAAYSMGAMSIKAYSMKSDNPGYDSDASDVTKNEVTLGLSF